MKRTLKQNKTLHVLIGRLHIDEETKQDLVHQYTRGRTIHSSHMTFDEANQLIRALRKELPDPAWKAKNSHEAMKERKRKRIISHMAEAGFILPDGSPDMKAIHTWVQKQAYKKHLNRHSSEELSVLIYAADEVRQHFYKKMGSWQLAKGSLQEENKNE